MERGLPRPLVKIEEPQRLYPDHKKWEGRRYPLPYTAQENAISLIAEHRARECVKDRLCFVCGLEVNEFDVWGLKNGEKGLDHGEAGPYHKVCADITKKMCPHVATYDWKVVQTTFDELEEFTTDFW